MSKTIRNFGNSNFPPEISILGFFGGSQQHSNVNSGIWAILLLFLVSSHSTNLGRAAGDDLERGLGVEPHVRPPVDLPLVPLRGVARRVRGDPARRQPVELLEK